MDANDQSCAPSGDRFLGPLVRALLHGVVAAMASFLVYVIVDGISHNHLLSADSGKFLFVAIMSAAYVGFFASLALIVIGPAAAAFAWWPYSHGVKSYFVYVALGALAALSLPLMITVIGRGDLQTVLISPVGLWFAFSGAVGGWTFSRQLRRERPNT